MHRTLHLRSSTHIAGTCVSEIVEGITLEHFLSTYYESGIELPVEAAGPKSESCCGHVGVGVTLEREGPARHPTSLMEGSEVRKLCV